MPVELITSNATPPGGVVTLELRSANTDRLLKRVKVENALMDWYANLVTVGQRRGDHTTQYPTVGQTDAEWAGFDPLRYRFRSLLTNRSFGEPPWFGLTAGRTGWFPSGFQHGSTNWLWGTDQNVAVDTTQMEIPTAGGAASVGEVTGGAFLGASFVADGVQNKRGTVNPAGCTWTWSQQRAECVFGTSVGNGVWRSIGLGGLQPQRFAPGGLRASRLGIDTPTPTFGVSEPWHRAFTTLQYGTHFALGRPGSDSIFVTDEGGSNLYWWDMNDLTWAGGATAYQGAASSLPGSGFIRCVDTASDFWIFRNGVLYRCDTRPPNAINVVNTYDLSASLSGPLGNLAICYDGTSLRIIDDTNVHTVNTTTGGIDSSWAHGLSNSGATPIYTMAWNAATSELYVNVGELDPGVDEGWGFTGTTGQFSFNGTTDDAVIHRFTSAGTKTGALMGVHSTNYTDEQGVRSQAEFITPDGVIMGSAHEIDSSLHQLGLHSPSMATHALLGADLTKTVAEVLTVTYDFNYA